MSPLPIKTSKKTTKSPTKPTATRKAPSLELSKAQVALDAFFNIAAAWKLKDQEQMALLGLSSSTFYGWKKKAPDKLPTEKLERISYILGIYKALQILFTSKDKADAWVRKPNQAPLFGGKSALEYMMGGNVSDLYNVRRYLDAYLG